MADGSHESPVKPQDARDYERSLEMGNATSDGVAGRCISAQQGDGDSDSDSDSGLEDAGVSLQLGRP